MKKLTLKKVGLKISRSLQKTDNDLQELPMTSLLHTVEGSKENQPAVDRRRRNFGKYKSSKSGENKRAL